MKKQKWAKKQPEPRQEADIEKEYNEVCAALGGTTYQVEVLKAKQQQLQNKVHELVMEAAKRRELNAKEAEEKAKTNVDTSKG